MVSQSNKKSPPNRGDSTGGSNLQHNYNILGVPKMEKEYYVKSPARTYLTINDNSLSIRRKGALNLMTQGLKGEKTIPLKSITSVQIKKPGLTNGYIQFSLPGGNESKGGVFKATQDENTVMFSGKYYKDMLELKQTIESIIFSDAKGKSAQITSSADEILKFKKLLDEGIITQEEFDAKKKLVLGI